MKVLSLKDTGPLTELLQSILKKYGFYEGEVDGIFGYMTQNAVTDFQRSAGITPDGIVGASTWGYLTPFINGYTVHTIRQNDTFHALSEAYGTDISLIIAANPDVDYNNLTIGSRVIIPLEGSFIPTDVSYSYTILKLNADALLVRFPFLKRESIGRSVLRNDIPAIIFGEGERKVMYNASHHANEWITSVVLMKYLEEICLKYVKGEEIYGIPAREIYENARITFIPMVNPDGVNLVTGELTAVSGAYQYARSITPPDIPFPAGWAANIRGVDLNSNYPAKWEEARETKFALGYTSPGPVEYVGSAPLSEPESRAMAGYTDKNSFELTLSYHTQGEVIFPDFPGYDPPESREYAKAFSGASGYALSEPGPLSAFAGYKDWFIQTFNRPGYTIECGKGQNPIPISQFGKIYGDNLGILTLAATKLM